MGVMGLMSHILQHKSQVVEYVDLVEVARSRNGIEILCDFYSFEHLLLRAFWKTFTSLTKNEYLRILGGEYSALDEYITKLVKDLKSLQIDLVMFIDGAKGSSELGTKQKLETWKHRHYNDLKKLTDLMDVCKGKKQMSDVPETTSVRPVLLEVQMMETLKECKCEIVQLSCGEADYVIARNLHHRPRAYAVISNDSDFCIFKDCHFIPNELFDLENDLQLGGAQPLPEKPIKLRCGLVSSRSVSQQLGFRSQEELIELSIIGGNDFTSHHMRHLRGKVGLPGRALIADTAQWVITHGRVDNHSLISMEMQHNHELRESIHRSRQFYNLTMPSEEPLMKGVITACLQEGIRQVQYPANVMAMHHNFYWHRMLLEDHDYGRPCAEVALAPLRAQIYRMIMERDDKMVIEYGRTPFYELHSYPVYSAYARLPTANFVEPNKIFQNLRTFHKMMLHQEPDFEIKFFDRYGRKNGFTFLCLRYFLYLNTGAHLHLTNDEFMVVLATTLATRKVEQPFYGCMGLLPNPRCVTIGNWFQDIYRHAYQFLGKLLYLTHEFPQPKEIFSGAVYTAFYMTTMHEGMLRSRGFPQDWLARINHDMYGTIKENRHIIRYVVQGIFEFDDRF